MREDAIATSNGAPMTAEIINLRQVRKERERAERERAAAANRAKFGRTKAERLQADADRDLAERHVEGHKREDGEEPAC